MINRRSFLGMVPVRWGSGALSILRHGASENPVGLLPPPENGDWDWWRNLNRTPLTISDDPFASAMIRAAAARRNLWIVYQGGSNPGESRKISPLGPPDLEVWPKGNQTPVLGSSSNSQIMLSCSKRTRRTSGQISFCSVDFFITFQRSGFTACEKDKQR